MGATVETKEAESKNYEQRIKFKGSPVRKTKVFLFFFKSLKESPRCGIWRDLMARWLLKKKTKVANVINVTSAATDTCLQSYVFTSVLCACIIFPFL